MNSIKFFYNKGLQQIIVYVWGFLYSRQKKTRRRQMGLSLISTYLHFFIGTIGFVILENMDKPIDIGNLVMPGEVKVPGAGGGGEVRGKFFWPMNY